MPAAKSQYHAQHAFSIIVFWKVGIGLLHNMPLYPRCDWIVSFTSYAQLISVNRLLLWSKCPTWLKCKLNYVYI